MLIRQPLSMLLEVCDLDVGKQILRFPKSPNQKRKKFQEKEKNTPHLTVFDGYADITLFCSSYFRMNAVITTPQEVQQSSSTQELTLEGSK